MIAAADTGVDPRTVMIEPLDTFTANAAVTGAVRPHNLTVGAQQYRIKLLKQLHEIYIV